MSEYIFKSVFADDIQEFISLKRAVGFKYDSEQGMLQRVDTYFADNNVTVREITKEISDGWCRKRSYETLANQSSRISVMRVFSKYLNDIGVPAYIPVEGTSRKKHQYNAHVYTKDELRRFFAAVDASKSVPSECPYRGQIMPVFFRILYTSGMRVSELRLARICDINFDNAYIIVKGGKNQKDRIVPIHPSLAEKCRELKSSIHKCSPDYEYFFMQYPGKPMTLGCVYKNFRRYLRKAGIAHTGHGPRVHDFRHTFCVNLLLKWSKEGKDLMAYLPYMRTMLGHEGFEETAYYLKLTADAYPFIRESLQRSFPYIIEEVTFDDRDYY
ncbi:tyrosine-type recombinase/integrase [Butyrivibrio sp.]|uniref:tyrosine-type recombinase/integrase n=1 Tax=Butyrivibrio sp. TaxID=28121 RepID=UPI0025B9BCB0|nr:tyrosine-type recombinase/integrase [Butyrivibrio sp.]MBQ9305875.1 tyrosine-type recombinase/integrase [Butyrivibrio sp.]